MLFIEILCKFLYKKNEKKKPKKKRVQHLFSKALSKRCFPKWRAIHDQRFYDPRIVAMPQPCIITGACPTEKLFHILQLLAETFFSFGIRPHLIYEELFPAHSRIKTAKERNENKIKSRKTTTTVWQRVTSAVRKSRTVWPELAPLSRDSSFGGLLFHGRKRMSLKTTYWPWSRLLFIFSPFFIYKKRVIYSGHNFLGGICDTSTASSKLSKNEWVMGCGQWYFALILIKSIIKKLYRRIISHWYDAN